MDQFKFVSCNLEFTMSTGGHLPTQSHQESTNDPSRMNLNETLQSMQQSIKGLVGQFQGAVRDVEELKKSNGIDTIEKRFGDNIGGVSSPHHQKPFHESGYQGRQPIRGGRKGGLRGRGYNRPQEDFKGESDPNVFLHWKHQVENLFFKKVEFVETIHSKVHEAIEATNKKLIAKRNLGRKRVIFEPADWVWVYLRKERFPSQRKSKLDSCGDGPFQVLERVKGNTYKIDLLGDYNVKIQGQIYSRPG
ncbi:hypothetical protein M9H77_31423 [Catharanthus roseus]|uniref:Uncharacterized protein n=1 Tax=Catharanthus roseus TaxID=4058 RepID=A0ACC0A0E7_CATRO|nr:hypothetical protein M9H77_31423 [Catharanthus roseus]